MEVRPPTHEPSAVETLVRAFTEDPAFTHLFPDVARRPAGLAHVFRMQLRHGLRHGRVDTVPGDAAVAIWARPENTWPTWWQLCRVGMLVTPLAVGLSATWRLLRFQHLLESTRRRLLNAPHWYLFAIGVRPQQQGQGLGAALLRHGVERARITGFPVYLETTQARNLPLYEKHGFRVMDEARWAGNGPRIWSLVAKPDRIPGEPNRTGTHGTTDSMRSWPTPGNQG
jgi:ribosomal protein S18 acetylase RimI-like enzyme